MKTLTIYSDASFCTRTQAAGGAYWACLRDDEWFELAYEFNGANNSLDAEIMGVCFAAQQLARESKLAEFFDPAIPSQLVFKVDCLGVIPPIQNHTLDGRSEKAVALLERLKVLRTRHGFEIAIAHVKAHTSGASPDSMRNNWCDVESRKSMQKLRDKKLQTTLKVASPETPVKNTVAKAATIVTSAKSKLEYEHYEKTEGLVLSEEELKLIRSGPKDTPVIGEYWASQGGIYLGVYRHSNGRPRGHLIADLHDIPDVVYSPGKSAFEGNSNRDGPANTNALAKAAPKSIAARVKRMQACGFNDWYVPASFELVQLLTVLGEKLDPNSRYIASDGKTKQKCLHISPALEATLASRDTAVGTVRPVRRIPFLLGGAPSKNVAVEVKVESPMTPKVTAVKVAVAPPAPAGPSKGVCQERAKLELLPQYTFAHTLIVPGNHTLH